MKYFTILATLAGFYLSGCYAGSEVCGGLVNFGCYQKIGGSKDMPVMIYNGRSEIDWNDYISSLGSILCKCEKLAKEKGYETFGLQFYGECWGSKKNIMKLLPRLKVSNDCIDGIYKPCQLDSSKLGNLCVGQVASTFLYTAQINNNEAVAVDGGYSEWTNWSQCSVSCNAGVQRRERECSNPEPKNGGKQCKQYLGESSQARPCSLQKCNEGQDEMMSFNCDKMEVGEEFNNLFSSSKFSPTSPFCGVKASGVAKDPSHYSLSVDLFSVSQKHTRMGIFFNSMDNENYEFVYVHLKGDFYCYSTGKVENGRIDWRETKSDQCNQVFRPQRWIQLEVEVNGSKAQFKGNNELLVTWEVKDKDSGRGGIILKNEFMKSDQSQVHFKDLKVQ